MSIDNVTPDASNQQEEVSSWTQEAIDALQTALDQEKIKSQEHWDRLLRKEADLQNIQRRAKQDIESAQKFGLEGFVRELLLVLDTFERGIEAAGSMTSDNQILIEGLSLTHKMLMDTLVKHHVTVIAPEVGTAFDPLYHQAISAQESPDYKTSVVLALAQKGYLLHGRLVRPAQVVVSKV